MVSLFYRIGNLSFIQNQMGRFRGNAAILAYHRILPVDGILHPYHFNGDLVVSLRRFEEQMAYLAGRYPMIKLSELAAHLSGDREFAVAITFDDGYRDILYYALPILEKYRIPATVYATTGFLDGSRRIWWYELEEICRDRSHLILEWNGEKYQCELRTHQQKLRCFRKLRRMLQKLSELEILDLIDRIRPSNELKNYSGHFLDWDEIRDLSRHPLITIGAHTHSHVNLNRLPFQDRIREVQESKSLLERKLDKKVVDFAYPYGGANDIPDLGDDMLEGCGFRTAVTTQSSPLTRACSPFRLPRFTVFERDTAPYLSVKLSGWNTFCFYYLLRRIPAVS